MTIIHTSLIHPMNTKIRSHRFRGYPSLAFSTPEYLRICQNGRAFVSYLSNSCLKSWALVRQAVSSSAPLRSNDTWIVIAFFAKAWQGREMLLTESDSSFLSRLWRFSSLRIAACRVNVLDDDRTQNSPSSSGFEYCTSLR